MKDSKLIAILKLFTKDEIKSFEKLIISPYFSIGRDVSGLFAILKKSYPDFPEHSIEKAVVFSRLFPAEEFSEKKLINLSSDLTKLAEQFLVQNSIRSNESENRKILAEVYKTKKNDKLFLSTIRTLDKKITGMSFDSNICFDDEVKKEKLEEEFYIDKNDFSKSIPLRIKYTDHLTLSFIVTFLRKLRDRSIVEFYYRIPFNSSLIDAFSKSMDFEKLINILEEQNYEYLWLIKLYFYAYECTESPEKEDSFNKFKSVFFENFEKFSHKERYYIFNDFVTYLQRAEEHLGKDLRKEILEIYKNMIERNSYSPSEHEYLSVIMFRNVLLISSGLKDFKWLKYFIDNYTSKLKPEFQENMKNLALATLCFEENEYEPSLKYLVKVKYDFFLYKLDVKSLMLKLYYELSLYDQAFSLIDAARNFLRQSKELSAVFKQGYSNFLNFYSKLLKAKSSGNSDEIDFELKNMEKTDAVANRHWLKSKASELINKRS